MLSQPPLSSADAWALAGKAEYGGTVNTQIPFASVVAVPITLGVQLAGSEVGTSSS